MTLVLKGAVVPEIGAVYRMPSKRFAIVLAHLGGTHAVQMARVDVHRMCLLPDGDFQVSLGFFSTFSVSWHASEWVAKVRERQAQDARLAGVYAESEGRYARRRSAKV
jgi:hypothetical protein